MVPISWCEMQCPRTHAKEFRKVARVQPEYLEAWEPWNSSPQQGTHNFSFPHQVASQLFKMLSGWLLLSSCLLSFPLHNSSAFVVLVENKETKLQTLLGYIFHHVAAFCKAKFHRPATLLLKVAFRTPDQNRVSNLRMLSCTCQNIRNIQNVHLWKKGVLHRGRIQCFISTCGIEKYGRTSGCLNDEGTFSSSRAPNSDVFESFFFLLEFELVWWRKTKHLSQISSCSHFYTEGQI